MKVIVYLFQVSASIGIFYLLYYLLLNKLTFFTTNGWYLMLTLAFSFFIPLLTITVKTTYMPHIQDILYVSKLQNLPVGRLTDAGNAVVQPVINWLSVIMLCYLIPVMILSVRLGIRLSAFFAAIKGESQICIGYIRIVRGSKSMNNGSFLNYIFLNDDEPAEDIIQQIIQHEMLHIRLLHSVDRIVMEIMKIVLWFNPFIYLYARAVEENHEFEVDREIGRYADKRLYADMLLRLSIAGQDSLNHSFSKPPLERRIIMIFKQPTKKMKRIIYVLILPLALLGCLAFANLKSEKSVITSKSDSFLPISINKVPTKPSVLTNRKALADRDRAAVKFDSKDQSSEFYSRRHIRNQNGESFDKVTFRLANGTVSANLGPEDKLGVFIDGVFYNEEDIKDLSVEKAVLLTFGECPDDLTYKIPGNVSYAVPFCFKSKTNQSTSDTTGSKQK